MSGISFQYTRNLMVPGGTGDYETLIMPNDRSHVGRRGVIFCHGYNDTACKSAINLTLGSGIPPLLRELAKRGVAVVAADLGGQTFGNDLAMTRIGQARSYLQAEGCATDKVLFVADSMGNWLASRYAADNPGQVASILAIEPGVDLNAVRDNNILNAQADINTAWGLAAGSTSATVPLPARAALLTRAAAGDLVGVRYRGYYSTADAVVTPQSLATLVAAIGPTAERRAVPGTPAHGTATTSSVPYAEAAAWLVAAA